MATFTIKIKHPVGLRVQYFRIHNAELRGNKLYEDSTTKGNEITIESDLEVSVIGSNVNIEIYALGESNLLIKFNVERESKKLFKNDVEVTTKKGVGRRLKEDVII